MELVYVDEDILVCLKPARVLSTDEPGGVPDLCREALGDPKADVRTVHPFCQPREVIHREIFIFLSFSVEYWNMQRVFNIVHRVINTQP